MVDMIPAEFYYDLFEVKGINIWNNWKMLLLSKKIVLLRIMWLILMGIEIGNLHILEIWKDNILGLNH